MTRYAAPRCRACFQERRTQDMHRIDAPFVALTERAAVAPYMTTWLLCPTCDAPDKIDEWPTWRQERHG